MNPIRLGAVSYLNTRPLVYGLDARPDLFTIRYDVPAACAALLHAGEIDLGLIPAIEYLRGDYRIVPGVCIGSDGPVASVALFTRVPVERIRTIVLDSSSRTSAALTRLLCAERWGIAPAVVSSPPGIAAMLEAADAALVIGDPALEIDAHALGVEKIDLGSEWQALTGLPFVYAVWAGRENACGPAHVAALNDARACGAANIERIARAEAGADQERAARIARYLRHNLKHQLGDREIAGLRRFHELAVRHQLAPGLRELRFFA